MKYLLDTNTCIRHINGRAPSLREKLLRVNYNDIVVCSIVKAEMFYGSMKSQDPARSLAKQEHFLKQFVSLPFDDNASYIYGTIRADLEKQGTPIGLNDLLIAAIALANDLTLITHNVREFGRIANLRIEDWESE